MKKLLFFGTLSTPFVYALSSESRRRKVFRGGLFNFSVSLPDFLLAGVSFWSKALPVYLRYRWEEFVWKGKDGEAKDAAFDRLHRIYAPISLDHILSLRGLYVKLGQIMTTRADYAPPAYLKEYWKLQDAVPARPFSEIASVVKRELGVEDLSQIFQSIEDKPLGAATIAQVHGAVLVTGERVVIKVQYEEVEELFMEDLRTVKYFCKLLQPEFLPMMEEMERQFLTEFDFRREGWALEKIGKEVNEKFGGVHIPIPYRQYCTKRVCVMERLDGVKLVDGLLSYYKKLAVQKGISFDSMMLEAKENGQKQMKVTSLQLKMYRWWLMGQSIIRNFFISIWNHTSGLIFPKIKYFEPNLPVNFIEMIDTLVQVHGYEIFQMGVFNGDCHPGNVFLMPDESLGLIDYGQVKELTEEERCKICKLIVALCADDSKAIVNEFKNMGFETEKNDEWVIERTARFFFEDDTNIELKKRKDGSIMNLQQVTEYLNEEDKTKKVRKK